MGQARKLSFDLYCFSYTVGGCSQENTRPRKNYKMRLYTIVVVVDHQKFCHTLFHHAIEEIIQLFTGVSSKQKKETKHS